MTAVNPEHRAPTTEEVQAIVDSIDILIASSDRPPYDIDSLPRTQEELLARMNEGDIAMAGVYPAAVPKIPLIPVDDLIEFAVKRYPREAAAYNPGYPPTLAMVIRCMPRLELGIDAETYEVTHIQEMSEGLSIKAEGTTRTTREGTRSARDFFAEYDFRTAVGLNALTAADCMIITDQLSRTSIDLDSI